MTAESEKTRIERDSMGEMEVPADALWTIHVARCRCLGERFPPRFVRALGVLRPGLRRDGAPGRRTSASASKALSDSAHYVKLSGSGA